MKFSEEILKKKCMMLVNIRAIYSHLLESRPWKNMYINLTMGFSGGSDGKESACNAGHPGLIHGWERFPEGGHGNPLQYPCLENPMDIGAWQATVHRITNSYLIRDSTR